MVRRTQLFYRDVDQGLGAVPAVAARMAEKLGWDDARRQAEIARYEAVVEQSRAWRRELDGTATKADRASASP